jgi:hypothetical protein
MAQFVLVTFSEGKDGKARLFEAADEDQARTEAISILSEDKVYTSEFTTGELDDDWDLDGDALHEGIDGDFGDGWMVYPVQSAAAPPAAVTASLTPAKAASVLRFVAHQIEHSLNPNRDHAVRDLTAILNGLS